MKKACIIGGLILIFLITYFIQANFFSWFTIAGIKPNLFVILVLFIGLFAGNKLGLASGIIFGLYLDIILNKNVGITAILLGIIGFSGGVLDKNFSKESRITIMLMVIGGTAIFEIGSYVLRVFMQNAAFEIVNFLKILSIEILYNTIITIILYPIIQKAGYYIEDEFKGNKILTRYF